MATDGSQKVIRITKSADEKLIEIARRKHLSKSKVASRIIVHYYSNNIGVDLPSVDDYQNLVSTISRLDAKVSKIIGPVERTEDWIKCLVREERLSVSDSHPAAPQEIAAPAPLAQPSDDRFVQALGLLDRFFSVAAKTTDFEGRAAMQIRFSQDDFNQLKREYEALCTSHSM